MSSSAENVNESKSGRSGIVTSLFAPVDAASVAVFRMTFGAILVWEVYRYFAKGWIDRYWVEPVMTLHYYGLDWIGPLPRAGMHFVFGLLGISAALVAAGLAYRIAAALFCLLFAYVFFLDQSRYLNHFYLVFLLSMMMVFIPAHREWAIDARLQMRTRSRSVPGWCLWLLRFQIGVVYIFGGIQKFNGDWFRGEPMRMWLARKTDWFLVGPLFDDERTVALFTFGGIAFDLLVVPGLLWRRTRPFAFAAALAFHLFNSQFFKIGIFPWLMIAATTLFFAPDWPRRFATRLTRRPVSRVALPPPGPLRLDDLDVKRQIALWLLSAYAVFQLLFPLRAFLYPGNHLWTEEGMWFSWNMMLSEKQSSLVFTVVDPQTNQRVDVYPEMYVKELQYIVGTRCADSVVQIAHHIAQRAHESGSKDAKVYVRWYMSMNGREPQLYVDPNVDFAAIPRGLGPKRWILPLEKQLMSPADRASAIRTRTKTDTVASESEYVPEKEFGEE
ncbi:MAG: HTTM domain-containing protein [Candidatus Hydrogenedentota bacterium]